MPPFLSFLLSRCAALGAALLLSLPLAGGVPERLSFRSYGLEQGLGNLAVWQIIQDQTGFIWTGTEDGLYRFDGVRFKAFGLREGLPSTFVECLHQQPDGTFWVGTYTGLARWDGKGFQRIKPEDGLPSCQIKGLGTSQDGTLWVGTPLGLFLRAPGQPFRPAAHWPGGNVTALWASASQTAGWAASWSNNRSSILRGSAGTWAVVDGAPDFSQEPIQALAVDAEATVWARTLGGLWSLPAGSETFTAFYPALPSVRQRGNLGLDGRGRIRVTTDEGLYTIEGGRPTRLGEPEGLPRAWASTTLDDREGSLWVGSNGLFRLQGGGAWKNSTAGTGLPDEVIWTIWRDRAGQLFLGTDKGLVQQTATGWRQVPGTPRVQIRSILQDGSGAYFMAAGPEVVRWDPKHGTLTHFGAKAGIDSPGDRIFRLTMDRQGVLWVGTDSGGLLRGTGRGEAWTFQRQSLPGENEQERILDLHLDPAGRLWVAGSRGLAMGENGHWKRFTTANGLLHDHVAYLTGGRNGDLLAAYFEPLGLTRAAYDPATGQLTIKEHLNAANGLASDKVYLMGEDARGNLWVGSGMGVDLVGPNHQVEHFSSTEGLVNDDTDSMAFLAEANGDVWIGTSQGLSRFDARLHQGPPQPPTTAVLQLKLGSRVWQQGDPLTVHHAANTFEVSYAGLSFIREGAVQYQVRLVGLEPEWRITEERSARYPGLDPGKYVFEVRSRVGRGAWGPVWSIAFEILPAWWQTWWFYALVGLGGTSLILAILRWRVLALHQRNRLLEKMVQQRTQEVQTKAEELEQANEALRNQSLTDPLTGLRNRRFLGICMPEDVAQVRRVHKDVGAGERSRQHLNIDLIFLMVDIDHFKAVNDQYGHAAGDLVLQQVAAVLRQATRDTDTVVRWGGEEFLVVARNAAREESTILAERVRALVAAHPFDLGDGRIIHRTCSVGFTYFPFLCSAPELFLWEQVVDLADHCLYAAKRGGRDAWVGLIPGPQADGAVIREGLPLGIPGLLEAGAVVALHSFREGFAPSWELAP